MLPFQFVVYDDTQKFSFRYLWNCFSINFKILCMCSRRSWWIDTWKYHIMWVFLTFSESLLTFNHSAMLFNSWLAVSYISSKSSQLVKRWVSSANKNGMAILHTLGNLLYIYKKQQWSYNRPLGNTTLNWLGWWLYTIIGYILWSIRQVTLKPIISRTSNTIIKQFAKGYIMVNSVKGLWEIYIYTNSCFTIVEYLRQFIIKDQMS